MARWMIVAAAFWLALTGGASALAQGARLETGELATKLVPSPGKYTVLLPPGYDPAKTWPLVLLLHGGNGDNGFLAAERPVIEAAWAAGDLPPAIILTPDAKRSLYMDYRDGSQKWESYIVGELIPAVRARYHASSDRSQTVVTGISMGGLGSLRLGFDHPEVFGGLAALEPGIEPALSFDDVKMRNRFQRDDAFFKSIFGDPVDRNFWKKANPANMALDNREKILGQHLQIYLEVGDLDMFHLDEGTEYLHRVMWDHGIPHEYRLVHGADHLGKSLGPRLRDGFRFLTAHVLAPPPPDTSFAAGKATIDALRRRMGVPDDQPRPALPPTSPPKP
ncbi:alpha/beta hydrolase [Phenylobacterium sp.]|uniref:alpha/beta hydrolase n=1 Tax=Phenylobacterium sp. TaxID=1871053 RepID=UPI002BC713FF|nr:alpha/beta hydrolase-fold protein [Phenylobacterium sp.]HLZ75906.1 alpha/beta hydrolase-fold protein [Phenylobacterium sp.]